MKNLLLAFLLLLNLHSYANDNLSAGEEAYIKGRYFFNSEPADYKKARDAYEESFLYQHSQGCFFAGLIYFNGAKNLGTNASKAKTFFEKSLTLGFIDSAFYLGELYYYGDGVEKDLDKAIEYYQLASETANQKFSAESYFGMAEAYTEKSPPNYKKATEAYKKSCAKQYGKACHNLGYYYSKGKIDGTKNYLEAKKWYEQAHKLNFANAALALGNIYRYGDGVDKDLDKAIQYYQLVPETPNQELSAKSYFGMAEAYTEKSPPNYKKATEAYKKSCAKQYKNACHNLGYYYYHGKIDDTNNYIEAKKWFEQALKLNSANAALALGELYYYGDGVDKDLDKAIQYYQLVPETPNQELSAESYFGMAEAYTEKSPPNYKQAIEPYKKSCLKNHKDSCFNLGFYYSHGQFDGTKNYLEAKKWYEKALKLNSAKSAYALGSIYHYGDGVEKDLDKAIEYYQIASETADQKLSAESYFGIAETYTKKIPPNYKKATEAYKKSCAKQFKSACHNLGYYHYYGKIDSAINYGEARKWFEKAYLLDSAKSAYFLGDMYYYGKGVTKDLSKAIGYYQVSAKKLTTKGGATSYAKMGAAYIEKETPDFRKSAESYEKGCLRQDKLSCYSLGYYYYKGKIDGAENYLQAKKWFEKAYDLKDIDAAFFLGHIHYFSDGVHQDLDKAMKYYQVFSDQKKNDKLTAISDFYIAKIHSKQSPPDYHQANKYYKNSCLKGFENACFYLGKDFLYGSTNKNTNYPEARKWFEKAYELGKVDATLYLGDIYYFGFGVEKDLDKAIDFYQISSETTDQELSSESDFSLAVAFTEKNPPNYKKAAEAFKKSCSKKYKHACYNLGYYYYYGKIDGTNNYIEAKKWFEEGDALGDSESSFYLGEIYYFGSDTEKNIETATKFYKKAYLTNHAHSAYRLGSMYYTNGKYHEAQSYFEKALEFGLDEFNLGAQGFLATIYLSIIPQPNKKELALSYLENNILYDRSDLAALFLGSYYFDKKINSKLDFTKSLKYLYISEELGNAEAVERIEEITKSMTPEQISEAKQLADEYMKQLNAKDIP